MHKRVKEVCKEEYCNTFFCLRKPKDKNEDVVSVEEFEEGAFVKYVNNDGVGCEHISCSLFIRSVWRKNNAT